MLKVNKPSSNLNEFAIIETYFNRQPKRVEVIQSVGDDCALIKPPVNALLAISTDTLIEGTHFYSTIAAADLGYKALAVNLSDLAAMGAEPAFILLSLTLQEAKADWLLKFAEGFFELATEFNIDLVGGNIAKGPLSITVQVQGYVKEGKQLKRSAAQVGDLIFVSGELGTAGTALQTIKQDLNINEAQKAVLMRAWQRPYPKINLGLILSDIAHAAIDISDGLAADLTHLLQASQVGARLEESKLPIAQIVKEIFSYPEALQLALTGGEDYELCFTAPAQYQSLLEKNYHCRAIGVIESEPGLRLQQVNGNILPLQQMGFRHF
ncbi:MAG: thiamine-phosphate kinase [Gammaproteobacteria bacterium RIFCSPHIGHO2_12_FULL_35_23]|nr:MAG: thiamine-phosphate kinase [Gammaproteobacteria bacterium RIFCSPHIGHO2_12_FULL_35_23]